MTASGPTALPPDYTGTADQTLAVVNHHGWHDNMQDELRALWTKFGLGATTPSSTSVLVGTSGTATAWTTAPTFASLNISTSGAAAGELKTSAAIKAGLGLYPSGGSIGFKSFSQAITASATLQIATNVNQGLIVLSDANTGHNAMVTARGGAGVTTTISNDSASTFNIASDAGSIWAFYWDGGGLQWLVKNRSGSTRTIFGFMIASGV